MKRYKRKKLNSKTLQPCNVCLQREYLVEHHIRGRKIINHNTKSNLCYVCSNCHMKIHKGDIIIEDWGQTTQGRELLWHTKEEESITGNDALPHLF